MGLERMAAASPPAPPGTCGYPRLHGGDGRPGREGLAVRA
ncbi:hypothetical protein SBD_0099 [Streptomyces bottropensis ATCC 25435]|uniref:Uncharacterized protein n=1 Tax=Streptomyces bottropensis ATCC 25435 TaxID=1054862 RepID=M3DKL4_9ACTN|nr:hypothetical protein SBD_0099 [Streptomyces bottropensis ATCC 25435]